LTSLTHLTRNWGCPHSTKISPGISTNSKTSRTIKTSIKSLTRWTKQTGSFPIASWIWSSGKLSNVSMTYFFSTNTLTSKMSFWDTITSTKAKIFWRGKSPTLNLTRKHLHTKMKRKSKFKISKQNTTSLTQLKEKLI